jgi:hypothetical protein
VVYLVLQTRKWRKSQSGVTVSSGMEETQSLNMPVHNLKVAILPLNLPCYGTVTNSGEISNIGNSHRMNPGRFSLNDDTDVKDLSRFKYGTWNIRGIEEG